jgi:hypothetical protein
MQRTMNASCDVSCPTLKTQTIAQANKCLKSMNVKEDVDSCDLPPSELWRDLLTGLLIGKLHILQHLVPDLPNLRSKTY